MPASLTQKARSPQPQTGVQTWMHISPPLIFHFNHWAAPQLSKQNSVYVVRAFNLYW